MCYNKCHIYNNKAIVYWHINIIINNAKIYLEDVHYMMYKCNIIYFVLYNACSNIYSNTMWDIIEMCEMWKAKIYVCS